MAKRTAAERRRLQAGFSLPELLTVMITTVMFSGLVMYFAFSFWRSTATLQADSETLVSRLTAGDLLRDAINESSGLIIQNSIGDANAHVPDPGVPGGQYWQPIHAVPGTIVNTAATYTPVVYFRKPSVNATKTVILNGIIPYEDEYILYMDGSTREMRLRTLANSFALNNRAATTCPPSAATSTCRADRLVAENVESVEMRYFSRAGIPVDYESVVDSITGEFIGPDFTSVEVVEFDLRISKKSKLKGGIDTSNQTVIRIALRSS
jgi:Tfp pilus assembly protein FimT